MTRRVSEQHNVNQLYLDVKAETLDIDCTYHQQAHLRSLLSAQRLFTPTKGSSVHQSRLEYTTEHEDQDTQCQHYSTCKSTHPRSLTSQERPTNGDPGRTINQEVCSLSPGADANGGSSADTSQRSDLKRQLKGQNNGN